MQGILLVGVLDEVINDQGKGNGSCLVVPESWCDGAWCIAMECHELLKMKVGQETSLQEAIHAMLDLDIDMAIVD